MCGIRDICSLQSLSSVDLYSTFSVHICVCTIIITRLVGMWGLDSSDLRLLIAVSTA